jgi:hypothetical protein
LLKERISSARQESRRIQQECRRRVSRLQKVGGEEVVQVLTSMDKKQARVKTAGRKTLEKKFQNLKSKKEKDRGNKHDEKKTVVNLSKRTLSEIECSILRKGSNYAVAPTRPPKFEIIKSVETAAVRLAPEKAQDYRAKIKLLLEKCKKFRTNTTQEEEAIKELAKDKSIKILKADKGNVTVVMDTEDYENKLTAMVNTEKCRKINRDLLRP